MSDHPTAGIHVGKHPWRQWPAAERTVVHLLQHAARTRADELVLTIGEQNFSAGELAAQAAQCAAVLQRYGAQAGDRIVMFSPNRAEIPGVFFGSAWLGSTFVPINPALRGDLLRHQLRQAAPRVVMFDDSTAEQLFPTLDVFDDLPLELRPVIVRIGTAPLDGSAAEAQALASPSLAVETFELAGAGIEPAPVRPDTPVAVLFTSGTTGPSKGVVMPHGQFWWWSVIGSEELQLTESDVLYTNLPLFHTNALTTPLQALAANGRAVIGPKFSVSAFWQRLAAAGATVTFILGAMSTMLWNRRPERFDPSGTENLGRILAPGIDPAIKVAFEEFFDVQVLEGFGMTEIGVPLYTPVSERMVGVCGIAHPDYDVAVLDEEGQALSGAASGELAIRPRQPSLIADGYLGNPEATIASRKDLWFHTGDLVRREEDGVYRYLDRIKDSIRRRGENISSYEVETAFRKHAVVADAAAFGVPSPLGEDEVMVCLQLTAGAAFDPEALLILVAADLPAYAVPSYLRVMDAFPLTANGKTAKPSMRAEGVTVDTWEKP